MFISNKEKSDISGKLDRNKDQIENLVKHVAKLQVDIGKSDIPNVSDLRAQNNMLHKMLFGVKGEIKNLQQQFKMMREINDLIIKKVNGLEFGAIQREKVTIPKEKVQALKDVGIWQDTEKRDSMLVKFIREKTLAANKKEKKREYGRKYYQKKKAEKAALQGKLL
jgi:hypothetical protein